MYRLAKQTDKKKRILLVWSLSSEVSRRRASQLVWFGSLNLTHWPNRQNGLYSTSCCLTKQHTAQEWEPPQEKSAQHASEDWTEEGANQQKEDVETNVEKKKGKKKENRPCFSVREKNRNMKHTRGWTIFFFPFFSAFPINCLMLEL